MKNTILVVSSLLAIHVLAGSPPIEKGETAFVDFGVPAGRIKAMHGVNNAPIRLAREGGRQDEFARAGIPFMRTHDTCAGFGGAHYVDIPNIFPDFDADETKAENYDFAFTDEFLKPIVAAGTKVFYRLGVTIENHAWIKNYHAKPPKDFAKWARICEHVIRHYNEGWADGFRWNIEYWEIWNECEGSMMWDGTREQFFELYRVSANHLKKCFPQIKIGGYGSCGYYHVDDPENRVRSFGPGKGKCKRFVDWFEAFCAYVTDPKTAAPLDFHSWHFYWNNEVMDYSRIQTHAKYVRDTLDRFGLTKCESVMNEWNLRVNGYDGMKGMIGASFCADMFCLMQDSSVDLAMYYDATPTRSYCGLFAPPENRTTPCFEAFVAWNELYRLGAADRALLGDLMERAVYNALFAAMSEDGRKLRYYTPLSGVRGFWPSDDYCCPCNYRRVMGYLPSYVFYQSDKGILANLYAQQTAADVKGELTEIDMTGNVTKLAFLYLNNNKLQKLIIPVEVATFEAMNNEISEFSVVDATKTCKLSGNKLTIATLPTKPAGLNSATKIKNFTYAPQADLEVKDFITEAVLDLSAQLSAVERIRCLSVSNQ